MGPLAAPWTVKVARFPAVQARGTSKLSVRVGPTDQAVGAFGAAEFLQEAARAVGLANVLGKAVGLKRRARELSDTQFAIGMAESSALGALAVHYELIGLYWQLGRLFVSRQRAEGWAVDRFGPLHPALAAPDGVRSEKRTGADHRPDRSL